jgi:hypothetical protein
MLPRSTQHATRGAQHRGQHGAIGRDCFVMCSAGSRGSPHACLP